MVNDLSEGVGQRCSYCKNVIKSGEPVRVCPYCQTPHHLDCWNENQGCTTAGCQMSPGPRMVGAVNSFRGENENVYSTSTPSLSLEEKYDRGQSPGLGQSHSQSNPPVAAVPTHMLGAVLVTLFCCVPFGIIAIVFASKAARYAKVGMTEEALQASKVALMMIWASVVAVILLIAFSVVLGV